jgi:DNA-binding MarR family transcriptional regulator
MTTGSARPIPSLPPFGAGTGPGPDAPSVRTVLDTLRGREPMTGAAVREASGLPRRTVYAALRTLRERGVLMQRASLHDTRQTYFWLVGTAGKVLAARVAEDESKPSGPPVATR